MNETDAQVTEQAAILDWRELASPPEQHVCDCGYCEMVGEPEPVQWPTLVPVPGEPEYVTDRYLAIHADLAPVPEGYEGPVLSGGPKIPDSWHGEVLDQPPLGLHFRWQTMLAVERMGWRLRLLANETRAWNERVTLVAVVSADGQHIGWTAAQKPADDAWGLGNTTREYVEPGERP